MQASGAATAMDSAQAAFTAQLERHLPILRKVAGTYSSTPADRRDLMQEIALQLWKAWPGYDPARPFSTWMYRIALNVGISFLRGAGNPQRRPLSLDALETDPIDGNGADPELDDRIALLRRLIDRLGALDRALLLLYLDEQSYRQIAEVLGISETNVATKLSRLKQRLRQEMADDH
jgi:RNA polymerase sigma factor (sigma-70 family)